MLCLCCSPHPTFKPFALIYLIYKTVFAMREHQEATGGFNLYAEGASNAKFVADVWERPIEQGTHQNWGGGRSNVLKAAKWLKKVGWCLATLLSTICQPLPPLATLNLLVAKRKRSVSRWWFIRPIPTCQPVMPTRMFIAEKEGYEPIWWFGGALIWRRFIPWWKTVCIGTKCVMICARRLGQTFIPSLRLGAMSILFKAS